MIPLKNVSLPQVLDLLAIVATPKQRWRVTDHGEIRDKNGRCPLCALAKEITGQKNFSKTSLTLARKALGFDEGFCPPAFFDIVDMADKLKGNIRLKRALGMIP